MNRLVTRSSNHILNIHDKKKSSCDFFQMIRIWIKLDKTDFAENWICGRGTCGLSVVEALSSSVENFCTNGYTNLIHSICE